MFYFDHIFCSDVIIGAFCLLFIFFSFCLKVLNSFVIWKPQNSIWLLSDFLGCVEVLPRDIVKRWFHFASAVSFATSVLSFLFRSIAGDVAIFWWGNR